MSNQFQPLADGEVVSIQSTYRVSELAAQIRSKVADTLAEWADEHGVDGEALRFGSKGWEKGKVRLHLAIEFCPNDGEAAASSSPGVGSTASSAPMAPAANFSGGISSQYQAVAPEASLEMEPVAKVVTMSSVATETIPEFEPVTESMAMSSVATIPEFEPMTQSIGTMSSVAVAPPEEAIAMETPQIDSTLDDEQFDLGTMSEITGEIDMQLNDGEPSGYVDFDLSDSLPEVSLDDLVAQSEVIRPSIIDEVWNEMSQPNWPGVSRA